MANKSKCRFFSGRNKLGIRLGSVELAVTAELEIRVLTYGASCLGGGTFKFAITICFTFNNYLIINFIF